MATPPTFVAGQPLTAAQMNTIGAHLVKTQSLNTGTTTVSVTSAFSADYDNYLIEVSGGTMSGLSAIAVTMTGSAASYYGSLLYTPLGTGTPTGSANNNAASWTLVGVGSTTYIALRFEMADPYLAKPTRILNSSYASTTDAGSYNGQHNVATSYTGFTLTASTNFTGGTIRVYGYRNS